MNIWIAQCLKIVRVTLGNPRSDMELGVLAALGAITLILAIYKIGDLLGAHQASQLRAAFIMIVGIAVMLAGVAAINMYVVPSLTHHHTISKYLPIATAIILLLAIATPVMCLVQKTSYLSGLFALLLSGALAAVIVAAGFSMFSAASAGGKDLEKQKERKDAINKMM